MSTPRSSSQQLASSNTIDDLVDAAIAKGWMPPFANGVAIAPALGFPLQGLVADASFIDDLVQSLRGHYPNARILVIGYSSNPVSGSGMWWRSGLRDALAEKGVEIVDLSRCQQARVAKPHLNYSINVPDLAFTHFPLILVGPLAIHSRHGLLGMLVQQLGLYPDMIHSDFWSLPMAHIRLGIDLWRPQLCILDARRVILYTDGGSTRKVQVHPAGGLWIGSDSYAVDMAVANSLGLSARGSRILHAIQARVEESSSDVIPTGDVLPLQYDVKPTPFDYQHGAHEQVRRVLLTQENLIDRAVTKLDIPRIVSFLRRARGEKRD